MDSDAESRTIVEIIMMLAKNLGLITVAEGTETEEQVSQLRILGCGFAQGYFFSKPADHKVITQYLGKINASRVSSMPSKAHTAGAGAS
jgi:EAL domain-containing protein (putative c-di-GMP-specific phosphodiesterase class I)